MLFRSFVALISGTVGTSVTSSASFSAAGSFSASLSAPFSAPFSTTFSASSSASPCDQSAARCFSFVAGTGMLRSRGRNHALPSAGLVRDSKLIWKSRGKRCFVMQHKRTGDARVRAYGLRWSFRWKGVISSEVGAGGFILYAFSDQKEGMGARRGDCGR